MATDVFIGLRRSRPQLVLVSRVKSCRSAAAPHAIRWGRPCCQRPGPSSRSNPWARGHILSESERMSGLCQGWCVRSRPPPRSSCFGRRGARAFGSVNRCISAPHRSSSEEGATRIGCRHDPACDPGCAPPTQPTHHGVGGIVETGRLPPSPNRSGDRENYRRPAGVLYNRDRSCPDDRQAEEPRHVLDPSERPHTRRLPASGGRPGPRPGSQGPAPGARTAGDGPQLSRDGQLSRLQEGGVGGGIRRRGRTVVRAFEHLRRRPGDGWGKAATDRGLRR